MLYLLKRRPGHDLAHYFVANGFVVSAGDATAARAFASFNGRAIPAQELDVVGNAVWLNPDLATCEPIGESSAPEGALLASWPDITECREPSDRDVLAALCDRMRLRQTQELPYQNEYRFADRALQIGGDDLYLAEFRFDRYGLAEGVAIIEYGDARGEG